MSTTSPNFSLILATTSDTVAVDSHIANNFSTLDSVVGQVHTGTGQFKTSVAMTAPSLTNPVIIGTLSGTGIVIAATGSFNTITATGGAVTLNTLTIGTYGIATAIGSNNFVLTVVTSNAQWAAASPNTGANLALSNLAAVALNTSIGTGSGGFFTLDRIIATSGALTGLTVFQATTGTFAGNLTVTGTGTFNTVTCTGGAITAGGITVGTYALPSTLGSSGQVLVVHTSTLGFATPAPTAVFSLYGGSCATAGGPFAVAAFTVAYDPAGSATATGYTTPSSGVYSVILGGGNGSGASGGSIGLILNIATTQYSAALMIPTTGSTAALCSIGIVQTVTAGVVISATATFNGANSGKVSGVFLMGYKMFDI